MNSSPTKRVLLTRTDVDWLPAGSTIQTTLSENPPPAELVTSVHCLCFDGDQLLMVQHEKRNLDIPGGHIEAGETLEQALKRELLEEAAAIVFSPSVVARLKVTLAGAKPDGYNYPHPTSYMVIFVASLDRLEDFTAEFGTTERVFLSPVEARKTAWVRENSELYEYALRRVTALSSEG